MPSFHPRRPRASPLWQLIHHTWDEFIARYETDHRPAMGPLRPETIAHVQEFIRCGDLAAGFTRYLCPDCGHQHLLAFTCKSRHFCPACHQRRTLQIGTWIAASVCHPVPHRQYVFTIPKILRTIFRKRRHRLIQALLNAKLISQNKATELLGWKHSGFHIDNGGEAPVAPHDTDGRRRLAQYLLRAHFSLQKITWNPDTKTVIYRSRRSWHTKRNFEVFKATDFLAAAIEHIPPKGQQTIRYYGIYSNKTRGLTKPTPEIIPPPKADPNPQSEVPILPSPPKATARAMRPLWRDLILRVWGTDPLKCPCCQGTMRRVETISRPEEIQFFLRLLGLWEALISLPPPPEPPFDIDTFEPIHPPWQAIRAWIPADEDEAPISDTQPELWDQSTDQAWKAPEVDLGDGRILVLEYPE
jgi:hypothetical protein